MSDKVYQCFICGVSILPVPGQIKAIKKGHNIYCSGRCRRLALSYNKIICKRCGKNFYIFKYYNRADSICLECRRTSRFRRCGTCGRVFLPNKSRGSKFCSARCSYIAKLVFSESTITYKETKKGAAKRRSSRKVNSSTVSDEYVKKLLTDSRRPFTLKNPSQELIDLKRQQIILKREVKKSKETVNGSY